METTNTLPIFNLAREFGWNPTEASLFGASPIISGDTPVSNALYSVQLFGQAHQQNPRFCADKEGRVVPCNSPDRVQGGATGGNSNPIYGDDAQRKIDALPNRPDITQTYPDAIQKGIGAITGVTPETVKETAADWFKRIALLLFALVIVYIALKS